MQNSAAVLDDRSRYEAAIAAAVKNTRPIEGAEVDDSAARWFALLCEPGNDARAARYLVRRGFGIFQPYARNSLNRPQKDGTHRALGSRELAFPGYIFVRAWHIEQMIKRLLAVPGVDGVLTLAGTDKPVAIPEDFITVLFSLDWLEHGTGHVAVTGRRNRKRRPRPSHKISNRATRRTAELLNKWTVEVAKLDSPGRIGRLLEAILPSRS